MVQKMKKISTGKIALNNLKQKPFRLAGLVLLVAVVTFAFFGTILALLGLKKGTESLSGRMGADLMVVPMDSEKTVQGILLKGEPGYCYMDKSMEKKIGKIEGMKSVTSQFYMASSGQDCCDIPVQFIGFDSATDFVVRPWIKQVYKERLEEGAVVTGSDIEVPENKKLLFYGKEFSVAAKLEKTGTGADWSVFANTDTIRELLHGAKEKGFTFTESVNPDVSVSNIMVELKKGYDAGEVKHNIRVAFDGMQIIETSEMIRSIDDKIHQMYFYTKIVLLLLIVISVITLTIMFSTSANERRKEFAVIRMLGAKKTSLAGIIGNEALIVSAGGGILGITVGLLVFLIFRTAIEHSMGLPYLLPGLLKTAGICVLSMAVSLVLCPLSACVSIFKICRSQTYFIMREGE